MNKKPFFSANLISTNASGEYYGVRSFINVTAFEDILYIGQNAVTYDKLINAEASRNQLFLQYLDQNGKSCEVYLKYNTFLPSTAPKKLCELIKTINVLLPAFPLSKQHNSAFAQATEIRSSNKSNEVVVYSSKVSFPPFCPACFNAASKIAKFEVTSVVPSSEFLKIGFWLIPVCQQHKNLSGYIQLKKWSPGCKEIVFSFKNKLYSQAFLRINQAPLTNRCLNANSVANQIEKLRNLKFVIYEYYISAIFFSFLNLSDVQELKKNENQFIRGLKFNAITFTVGWWSFPFGPIYTILVLYKNLFGGTDITNRVFEVFQGKPFSALEE